VAISVFMIRHYVEDMDGRFFQSSVSGAKGLAWYLVGNYEAAADAYREDLRHLYETELTHPDAARQAMLRGDDAEATRIALSTLDRAPDDSEALLVLGDIAVRQDRPAEAAERFDRLLDRNSDDYDALVLASIAHAHLKDYGGAIGYLNRAFRTGERARHASTFLHVLRTTGELKSLPDEAGALSLTATYFRYLRIYDGTQGGRAIAYADRAVAVGDHPDNALLTKGVALYKQRAQTDALIAFLDAGLANPLNPEARRWAATVYADRGDIANQYRMLKIAYEVAPDDAFYADSFTGFLDSKLGDYHQALEVSHRSLARHRDDVRLLARLGRLYTFTGEPARSAEYYSRAISLQPDEASLHGGLGLAFMELGSHAEAMGEFQQAIALDPYHASYHRNLALVYRSARNFPDAIREYERAVTLGEPEVDYWADLCQLYYETSAYSRAGDCATAVLRQHSENTMARRTLMLVRNGIPTRRDTP
jgi:tetratricopeptide (TPR) repeat protein